MQYEINIAQLSCITNQISDKFDWFWIKTNSIRLRLSISYLYNQIFSLMKYLKWYLETIHLLNQLCLGFIESQWQGYKKLTHCDKYLMQNKTDKCV